MKRCAIYTRKSTEEGLDQEFNSLDAQREACEAYVLSQRHDGWRTIRQRFDDGGFSGGNLERPAMQKLLELVRQKQIDVVVVYKVDRLTRSLADFAKIVELMDASGVSFVSVTQQFNTTTSMGRLTLNVLLSFAQFEREVTAERIRDKIASSKQKGMWMGGNPPLGYEVKDRALVVNPPEAKTVRMLFRMYLDAGSVRALRDQANARGLVTKKRPDKQGLPIGGRPFSRGHLYQLLSNPVYIGQVAHNGKTYPGQHKAIVETKVWDAVQQKLASQAPRRRSPSNAKSPSFLAGTAFDETGDRLSPVHTVKHGRRYRYYVSGRLTQSKRNGTDGWRIKADVLEDLVLGLVRNLLNDPRWLSEELKPTDDGDPSSSSVERAIQKILNRRNTNHDFDRNDIVNLLQRVDVAPDSIAVKIDRTNLARLFDIEIDGKTSRDVPPVEINVPTVMRRRGVETKLVLRDAFQPQQAPDPSLCRLVAEAQDWFSRLASGRATSVRDLARQLSTDETVVSRALPLAFLAPDIVEAILDGRQPVQLSTHGLRRLSRLPGDWDAQRRLLGFAQ